MIKNRQYWNTTSDVYQATHGELLDEKPLAWGIWRIPESELHVLGPVEGLAVLELGCGAAQWSVALRQIGARAFGIDLSERQLAHARAASRRVAVGLHLVQGTAEQLPFARDSFDLVFCDHGATVFAPPETTVAEASRVLKPGGRFAFCMSTPIREISFDEVTDEVTPKLLMDYFRLREADDGESITYQLPYGAWIRLFRRCSLMVEDLVELQAPVDASTTYGDFVPVEWARKWPAEHIWKLRKERQR